MIFQIALKSAIIMDYASMLNASVNWVWKGGGFHKYYY